MPFLPWLLAAAWIALFVCDAQPIILVPNEDTHGFSVDVQQFAQLYSRHIVTQRVDSAFSHLSKRLAHRFREAFQVNTLEQVIANGENDGVDIRVLFDQLNGAIGAFVEDSMPSTWRKQASSLNLEAYIAHVIRDACSSDSRLDMVEYHCLREQTNNLITSIDIYVGVHMQQTMNYIMSHDMPQLIDTIRSHVQAVLDHFNQYILTNNRLELSIAPIASFADAKDEFFVAIRHSKQQKSTLDADNNPPAHTIHHFSSLARVSNL